MKAVPLLVLTNALALGLAIFALARNPEPVAPRTPTGHSPAIPDNSTTMAQLRELQDQVAMLQAQRNRNGLAPVKSDKPAGAPGDQPAFAAPGSGTGAKATKGAGTESIGGVVSGATDGEGVLTGHDFQVFRETLKKAQEVNRREERVQRVTDTLNQLVQDGKISPLSPKQADKVAGTILDAQEKIPTIWRSVMSDAANQQLSREDRFKLVRTQMDQVRTDAQKSLEDFLPAPDAKTIVDSQMNRGFRFGGGRTRTRSTNR